MTIKGSYLVTVVIAVSLIFIGHKIAVKGMVLFQGVSQEIVKAKVQKITGRIQPDFLDEFIPMQGETITFEAKVTSGIRKGETLTASQNLSGYMGIAPKETGTGDSVLLLNINDE
jgi:hypothetical protein